MSPRRESPASGERVVLLAAPSAQLDPNSPASQAILRNAPTLAIYYLAAILRESGYEVSTIDTVGYRAFLGDLRVGLDGALALGISSNTMTWPATLDAARAASALPERPWIILGGLHPTLFDEHVLRASGADAVVRGEGEVTLPALLDVLRAHSGPSRAGATDAEREAALTAAAAVPGVSVRRGQAIARGPDRPLLTPAELGQTPLPAYDLLPPKAYTTISLEASRGCRFSCGFCSIAGRRSFRPVPQEAFARRVREAASHSAKSVQGTLLFVDDCFTASPDAAEAARFIAREYPTAPLAIEARADDLLRPGLVEALTACTLAIVQVGIECGYDAGLRQVRKGITLSMVEEAFDRVARAGAAHTLNAAFIVGFPWEGLAEVADTVCYGLSLARNTGCLAQFGRWMPFPGSRFTDALGLPPETFDTPAWASDEGLQARATPRMTAEDWKSAGEITKLLKNLYPEARAV